MRHDETEVLFAEIGPRAYDAFSDEATRLQDPQMRYPQAAVVPGQEE